MIQTFGAVVLTLNAMGNSWGFVTDKTFVMLLVNGPTRRTEERQGNNISTLHTVVTVVLASTGEAELAGGIEYRGHVATLVYTCLLLSAYNSRSYFIFCLGGNLHISGSITSQYQLDVAHPILHCLPQYSACLFREMS